MKSKGVEEEGGRIVKIARSTEKLTVGQILITIRAFY